MRRAPGLDEGPRRVVRAPNHLGDVVMALPALAADGSDIVVRSWLAPLLEMAALAGRVLPFHRGLVGWRDIVWQLRALGYDEGFLLTPSFSAAWMFRWGGVRHLRGTVGDARTWMLADAVPRSALRGRHRINQYKLLMAQDPDSEARNHPLTPPSSQVEIWRETLGAGATVVGLFPGSNAPARRWPPERFVAVGNVLAKRGVRVVVLGGPGDRELTAQVAGGITGAVDSGGATDLPGLAALLSVCRLVVTNDTGPMHLAGAVGTPTVTLWGSSDPAEVRPVGARDARVTGMPIPCKPCFRNHCERAGAGTLLPDAYEECMRLIVTEDVVKTVESLLDEVAS